MDFSCLPVFSHGQLFVPFSRVRQLADIKVKVVNTTEQGKKNQKKSQIRLKLLLKTLCPEILSAFTGE